MKAKACFLLFFVIGERFARRIIVGGPFGRGDCCALDDVSKLSLESLLIPGNPLRGCNRVYGVKCHKRGEGPMLQHVVKPKGFPELGLHASR